MRVIKPAKKKNDTEPVTIKDLEDHKYVLVPPNEEWKVHLAREILEIKNGTLKMNLLDYKDLDDVLEIVTT